MFGGGILDGISSIIRGATQIISTPLTWCLRMPLRGLITAVKGYPTVLQQIESRIEALKFLVNANKDFSIDPHENHYLIDSELTSIDRKLTKAIKREQPIFFVGGRQAKPPKPDIFYERSGRFSVDYVILANMETRYFYFFKNPADLSANPASNHAPQEDSRLSF
jgi:hypothetical protein